MFSKGLSRQREGHKGRPSSRWQDNIKKNVEDLLDVIRVNVLSMLSLVVLMLNSL